MSHCINKISFPCRTTEKQILANLNEFAFDPEESCGYHGNMTFHRDIICKNWDEACDKLDTLVRRSYDDHAIMYKDGRKKFWAVKYEYHC